MIHRGRPLYFNEVNKQSFDSDESFYRFEQRQIPTESSDCYVVMKSPLENSNEEFHFKYEKMSPKKTAIDNAFIPKSNDVRIFPQKFGDRVVLLSSKMPKKCDKDKQTKKVVKTNTEETGEFRKNWQHRKIANTSVGSKTIGNVQNGNKVTVKKPFEHNTRPTGNINTGKVDPLKRIQTKEICTPGNYFIMHPNGEVSSSFVDQNDSKTSEPDDRLYINLEHILPCTTIKPMRKAPPAPLRKTCSSKDSFDRKK